MAFKIAINPTYKAQVSVELPGATSKSQFDAEFTRLSQSDLDALNEQLKKGEISDVEVAKQVLVGWEGLVDDGGPVEFSASMRDRILEIYPLPFCIARAFFDSLGGAKKKN